MPDASYWLIKILIAVPGAVGLWAGYRAFRRRQRDSSQPRDPTTDKWWRALFVAAVVLVIDVLLILSLSALGAPRWLGEALFVVLAAATLLAFAAAFALGWRGVT